MEILVIAHLKDIVFVEVQKWFRYAIRAQNLWGKAGIKKIFTYLGFKNGKLVSVLQSVNADVKEATDWNYCVSEPQEVEKQIEKWKKENLEKE